MRILILLTSLALLISLIACGKKQNRSNADADTSFTYTRTKETQNLLTNLIKIPSQGFMFGHQDDPLYGVTWEGDSDQAFEELIHLGGTESNLNSDRLTLTKVEVSDILSRRSEDCLLSNDH